MRDANREQKLTHPLDASDTSLRSRSVHHHAPNRTILRSASIDRLQEQLSIDRYNKTEEEKLAWRKTKAVDKLHYAHYVVNHAEKKMKEKRPRTEEEVAKERRRLKLAKRKIGRAEKTLNDPNHNTRRKRQKLAREEREAATKAMSELEM